MHDASLVEMTNEKRGKSESVSGWEVVGGSASESASAVVRVNSPRVQNGAPVSASDEWMELDWEAEIRKTLVSHFKDVPPQKIELVLHQMTEDMKREQEKQREKFGWWWWATSVAATAWTAYQYSGMVSYGLLIYNRRFWIYRAATLLQQLR